MNIKEIRSYLDSGEEVIFYNPILNYIYTLQMVRGIGSAKNLHTLLREKPLTVKVKGSLITLPKTEILLGIVGA